MPLAYLFGLIKAQQSDSGVDQNNQDETLKIEEVVLVQLQWWTGEWVGVILFSMKNIFILITAEDSQMSMLI